MYDNALRAAAAGNLSANEQSATGVELGQDLVPQCYAVLVPSVSGTTPTLDVKIQESDDNSSWRDLGVFPQINAAGNYYITLKSNAKYRRYYATLGGTTPNFGATVIALVPAGQYNAW